MHLTSEVIKGFTESILAARFDNPAPVPRFHEELWELACLPDQFVAVAAPRGHAKSTSMTLSFVLAAMLFRDSKFCLIVSDTEGQAAQFLGDIKIELTENEALIKLFGVSKFIKDAETNLIVEMSDGYQFRIIAKGSEQKVRGLKWRNKRPDLIVGDDLENDEMVMNKDRREKFRNWFFKALVPCGSDTCRYRIVGTILHLDSLLERLLNDEQWVSRRYAAHDKEFTEILWPEKFSKERLERIRQIYLNQGNPEGYSQEYLNYPIDEEHAYFKKEWFQYFGDEDIEGKHLYFYVGVDLAISEEDRADYTVFVVAGLDAENNMYIMQVRRGRWDGMEIVDELWDIHDEFNPVYFAIERGAIQKSLQSFIRDKMFRTGIFPTINPDDIKSILVPTRDKKVRARSIQARMREGQIFFPRKDSVLRQDDDWFPDFYEELVVFDKGIHDDQVDAFAWIGQTLGKHISGLTYQEVDDDEYEELMAMNDDFDDQGRNRTTGY